ncbi:MAG: hypothetical protein U0791_20495 [Gemmataceae bacterium]
MIPSSHGRRCFLQAGLLAVPALFTGCDPNSCSDCSGRGKKSVTCPTCNGSGAIGGSTCKNCSGSGKTSITCSSCNGSGKKPGAKS